MEKRIGKITEKYKKEVLKDFNLKDILNAHPNGKALLKLIPDITLEMIGDLFIDKVISKDYKVNMRRLKGYYKKKEKNTLDKEKFDRYLLVLERLFAAVIDNPDATKALEKEINIIKVNYPTTYVDHILQYYGRKDE